MSTTPKADSLPKAASAFGLPGLPPISELPLFYGPLWSALADATRRPTLGTTALPPKVLASKSVFTSFDPPKAIPTHDSSVALPSGSVTFKVQLVRFKIPKALLVQHAEGFASMLDVSQDSDSDEDVVLEDSAEAFEAFKQILMQPFESCLDPSTASYNNLRTILLVLALAHKYCASAIEKRVLNRAIALSRPENLSQETEPLIPHILELAKLTNQDKLAQPARSRLLDLMWSETDNQSKQETALGFGKKLSDHSIIGTAYYLLMRKGYQITWDTPSLAKDKDILIRGAMRSAEKWHEIQIEWATTPPCCQSSGCVDASRHFTAMVRNQRLVPWCDVIGKLQAAERLSVLSSLHADEFTTAAKLKVSLLKEDLYSLFFPRQNSNFFDTFHPKTTA